MEQILVDQIAAYWLRQRIIQMEAGMFEINRIK